MVTQIEEMKTFLAQIAGSNSKGPKTLTFDRAGRITQIHAAKSYAEEFVNNNARQKVTE